MDQNQARRMKDQHSRDEAELRRSQQLSAGDQYAPVESSPQHGAHPASSAGGEQAAVEAYERALRAERAAWESYLALPHRSESDVQWQDWRSAVEARDAATRRLINYLLEQMARDRVPSDK